MSLHDRSFVLSQATREDPKGAVDALRERSPRAALVFISGSSIGLPDALASEGAVWVRKPFEVGEVVAAVLKARGDIADE